MKSFMLFIVTAIMTAVPAMAQPFYSSSMVNNRPGLVFCDNNDKTADKSWDVITSTGPITQNTNINAAYADGGDAIGVHRHTITGNTERMRGSTSTTTGLLLWDGSREIVYEFGSRLIDSFLTSGAESTQGLINRISANRIGASFRFITTTSTTEIIAHTDDGTTETATSTGVNPFVWHRYKIVLSKTPRQARFYVDGVLVATNTTSIVAATTPLSPAARSARFTTTNSYFSLYDYDCVYVIP